MSKTNKASAIVILAAVVLIGAAAAVKALRPQGPDMSQFYPAQGRAHIVEDAKHPPYNSNPPSGGSHYALTARKGFYDEPVPDEYVVHNLEHGDIWIAYKPAIPEEAKARLKELGFAKVIITPREANETDIALVAWERVDAFDLMDGALPEGRIKDFVKRYRGKGPERVPLGAMESTFN